MTTRTQHMTAATHSMTMGYPRSRTAQATRSLRLAERLREQGTRDEYRAAVTQHFALFASAAPACPVR